MFIYEKRTRDERISSTLRVCVCLVVDIHRDRFIYYYLKLDTVFVMLCVWCAVLAADGNGRLISLKESGTVGIGITD